MVEGKQKVDLKVVFSGEIVAVKPRIKLLRSFDQIPSHQYNGYILVIEGHLDDEYGQFRVAIGPKAHEKHQFQIGDKLSGKAQPISNPKHEWAQYYKASALKVEIIGEREDPHPSGGVPVPLPTYRENGHLRLKKSVAESVCLQCPWGAFMTTEMIIDHWNPSKKKYRIETHCYGPKTCKNYKPGRPYVVPGRNNLKYEDDDYERFCRGEY